MNSGNPIPPKWRRVITEYRNDPTLENLLEILFKLKKRESCVKTEVYCGFIHFLSVCTGILEPNNTEYVLTSFFCGQSLP